MARNRSRGERESEGERKERVRVENGVNLQKGA